MVGNFFKGKKLKFKSLTLVQKSFIGSIQTKKLDYEITIVKNKKP